MCDVHWDVHLTFLHHGLGHTQNEDKRCLNGVHMAFDGDTV